MIPEEELLEKKNEETTDVQQEVEVKEETPVSSVANQNQDENIEDNKEQVQEDNSNDEILEMLARQNIQEKKKIYYRLIKLLIGFCMATIIYYICNIFDPFKNLQDNAEVQTNKMFAYIKYVMFISSVISSVGLLLLFLSKFNLVLEVSKKTLKVIVDVLEWVVILPICVAISSFLFSFVFTITVVDGSSMEPTLHSEEQLVLTYDKEFERFDIVVIDVNVGYYSNLQTIYQNNNYETLYVKRIIGMPGDYIDYKLINNVTYLYVNGELVEETFFNGNIKNTYYDSVLTGYEFSWKHVCDISAERCTGNGEGQLIIPEGFYFVLGDNRTDSVDSRKMGLVKEEDIIGVIKYRMTSLLKFEKIK